MTKNYGHLKIMTKMMKTWKELIKHDKSMGKLKWPAKTLFKKKWKTKKRHYKDLKYKLSNKNLYTF